MIWLQQMDFSNHSYFSRETYKQLACNPGVTLTQPESLPFRLENKLVRSESHPKRRDGLPVVYPTKGGIVMGKDIAALLAPRASKTEIPVPSTLQDGINRFLE